ncbi:MAG: DUF4440 domain-containing protein [Planctomycetota bacterium]
MNDAVTEELLALNQRLLNSITEHDWLTYAELCDPTLTAFEPEAEGQLVEGLDFHAYYFKLPKSSASRHATMASPNARVMGDVAVVAYTRLIQKLDADGRPVTASFNETRVWQRLNGAWRHVHFHRSNA